MQPLKMQPTFTVNVSVSADEAMKKIRQAIKDPELSEHVVSAGRCVDYKISVANQRFWSPHLSVQVFEADRGAEIFGRYSPRPEIWTMFMAVYFVAAILMFGAAIYAYVLWSLGSAPWPLAVVAMGFILIVALHTASLIGQSLSADQMTVLRSRLDRTLEIAFDSTVDASTDNAPQTLLDSRHVD